MTNNKTSRAKDILNFSFWVAFANDGTLDEWEVQFMKNLALQDGVIDDKEKRVLQQIFSRVGENMVTPETWSEITKFRKEFKI